MTNDDGEGERVVQNVLNNIIKVKELTASKNTDKELLEALVSNPIVQALAKAHTAIAEKKIQPVVLQASELSSGICKQVEELSGGRYQELRRILNKPHLVALLRCHDSVAERNGLVPGELDKRNTCGRQESINLEATRMRAIRMVGMYKKSWEPLGITVVEEKKQLKIARILRGSEIERKGLLHVDDVILEINGHPLNGNATLLKDYLIKVTGSLVFKILPSYEENHPAKLLYVKCHIDYDPTKDKMTPCAEAGLGFNRGEILQVVEQTDAEWWQARRVNNKGEPRGRAGLIPSQSLEEKRRTVQESKSQTFPDKRRSKRRKSSRRMYSVSQNSAFDKHDIAVYEEVTCIPPISRKTVVILMQSASQAEKISQEMVRLQPMQYGIADTIDTLSRNTSIPKHKKGRPTIQEEANSEHSDLISYNELKSARDVMKDGKTCIVITSPQSLKIIRTSEFLPYVVYVKMSENDLDDLDNADKAFQMSEHNIERYYMQYIDSVVEFSTPVATATTIIEGMDNLRKRHQWVPTSWVY